MYLALLQRFLSLKPDGSREPPSTAQYFSNRLFGAFARSNADRFFDRSDEYLSVADAPRLRALFDRVHYLLCLAVGHDDLDLDLWNEIDDVRRPAVDLFFSARSAEALYLGDGHALDAD